MVKLAAVIGSGVMGHGITQLYALAGYPVYMYDIREELVEKGMQLIEKNLTLLVVEGVITDEQKWSAIERIMLTTDMQEAVREADIVTEAIPELIELKWDLYQKLEQYCQPNAIIASNTSTFPIAKLIEKSTTTHRMLITHFFNPAQLVPLVEIVKHESVPNEVVQKTEEILRRIGKTPVLLKKDVPGFIANRLQAAIVREAFYLLKEGVADAKDIDAAVTNGPGFRWAFSGPIETADYGGLDTWKRVMDNLAPELDKSQQAPLLIDELVQQGKLGTKTGAGIFEYTTTQVDKKIKQRDEYLIRLAKVKN
ncbi:3-hydroxyacyl-CoA dehydrogenase family protein [Ammoniphilus sp. YIM 78166]|uniref:3-hydroxyacyl-CoA dehydrogenase family protein n=1 Tax=Ammoniphilus sp. YIM 78166 TaxID=1644106 RepID=UPI00106FD845|nr:3-hydroxyacyl-CoA dehydrogenase family protein [Ammoniphilus sp. YIM 78166]